MTTIARRTLMLAGAAAALTPGGPAGADDAPRTDAVPADPSYPFALPPLPYAAAANEPYVDAETMELHHDKHHAAYVNALNAAVKDYPQVAAMPLSQMLARLNELPEGIRATVRNNGGGHANHSMFWPVMGGKGGEPDSTLGASIARDFGSFAALKESVGRAGVGRFGSGWVMVLVDGGGKLLLATYPNQDSPLMDGKRALFGTDVWEHAYYLKYRNRRADYLEAWWNVVDWQSVGGRYRAAIDGSLTL